MGEITTLPDWVFPPAGGFTAEDLDRLPDLSPHTELLDGSLVFVRPPRRFHSLAVDLLVSGLRAVTPVDYVVSREMTVTLGKRDRPEPDISVVRASAVAEETNCQAADVLLVGEVVSPESDQRDRVVKPRKYAEAGIPNFWRVEQADGRRPVVYVFELDRGRYGLTGIHHDRLKVDRPFPVDIDLTAIDRY
ncbi:restriction endonuclease [Streptomyces tateyamensis]|uniref:Restriction endonuclease n=1 Tax=Streptomyces tateyamensis TaxID=565073 RepID=A0A2V4N612_9ACTN|nr:Uma2 family endonuclease [Streptomyces tateyamensis]PYC68215.1 restriction endonuclease [Streptomyces tateyamensis]